MVPDAERLDGATIDPVSDRSAPDVVDLTERDPATVGCDTETTDVGIAGAETSIAEEPPGAHDGPPPASRHDRLRKVGAIVFIAVVVLGAAVVTITRSPFFAARTIDVRGASHATRSQILRIAAVTTSTNVFTLDAGAAERRLERDPWIADATVTKDLPSTLVIDVRERFAVAVAASDGVLQLVADDGVFLEPARARVATELPSIVVMGTEGVPTTEGEEPAIVEPSRVAVAGGARAIAAMAPTLRRRVDHVWILADGELQVDLSSGASAAYGEAVDLREKAMALRALLDYAAERGATVVSVDVRVPSAPTAVLAGGEVVAP